MAVFLKSSFFLFFTLFSSFAIASECEQWLARIASGNGRIEIQSGNQTVWQQTSPSQIFCPGDKIRTLRHSRVTLEFSNQSLVTLEQNSTLIFPEPVQDQSHSWFINFIKGSAFFRSRKFHQLEIYTPFVNAVHEGTEFLVTVKNSRTEIAVFDGRVAAQNRSGEIKIEKGSVAIAARDQPPRIQHLTVKPEDAVQWALYYPPIVDYQKLATIIHTPKIKKAISAYRHGNIFQALTILEQTPKNLQNEYFFALKASLLLTVGSVEEALHDLQQAEQLESTFSTAMALKSVIALSKNQLSRAEEMALKAAKRNPESAIAQIALSYIYQAKFDINKALLAIQQATHLSPENALAWARLAELRLASGNKNGALDAAQKAQSLNPAQPRTQTVIGFVYLAQIEIEQARQAFSQAIIFDPSDPLAHLGSGLAKIRSGRLEQGTRELETAANLDPNNAIIRSYLGKAYYELKNENFAATEFSIAKEMDPNDPTPWFYDAILKQTQNRPIEALHDMQKAIELNDNRGVYRSKLLLDEDLAARSASLGRIYNDLGFQQLGLIEGWKSVTIDPANYSAHRLLADNYAALPRHEIARVSALLQSQLLQPINITPIQPRLAESDRLASNTLGSTSFNEYNSLFERNQFTFQGAGIIGNKDSYGEELVHAGIWNKLSYSIGQYHFQSDGVRENNAIKQDIYNAFVQYQLTDKLNLQFEYRYNFLKNGDLSQYFNNRLFSNTLQEKFKRQLYRIGGHYQPDPTTDVLFSGIYTKDDFSSGFITEFAGDPLPVSVNNNADTFSIELQVIKDLKWAKFIAGAGYINNNQPQNVLLTQDIHIPGFFIPGFFNIPAKDIALEINTRTDHDSDHINAYLYSFLNYKNLTTILGVSFDSIDNHTLPDIQRFNPKLGLLWNLFDKTTLRAAYFQGVKKNFGANQTIEPAQIAGFVQFFDDDTGTKYEHFGLGLDHKFNQSTYFGLEGTYRKLKVPVIISEPVIPLIDDSSPDFIKVTADSSFIKYERQHEFTARSYFNWTPTKQISTSIEYQLVILDRQISKEVSNNNPFLSDIVTHQVPISFNYFATNGLYSKFRATFVKQRVRSDTAKSSGHEHFWSIDALIGYKFPKRYGRAEFGIKNLLNENYQYADRNLITGLPSRARFLPERTLFGQVIFDFDVF